MEALNSPSLGILEQSLPVAYGKSVRAMEYNHIYLSKDESKNITIFTDEGDKVSISYDEHTEASYENLKALSYRGAAVASDNSIVTKEVLSRMQREQFLFENSKSLTISIDGDLNEQELEDIKSALNKIDEIMKELFLGGDIADAATGIQEIRDLESLSGVEAEYSYKKELVVEHYAVKEVATYAEYRPKERIGQDGIGHGRIGRGRHRKRHNDLKMLIDKMANAIEDSGVKPRKFRRHLKEFFANFLQNDKNEKHGHKDKAQNVEHIESALMLKLDQITVKEEAEATLIIA